MQGVEGQWNGELKIDGQEVPLHPKSLLQLLVFNTVHQNLPSLRVSFKDEGAQFVGKLGVRDGAQISLILGDGSGSQTPTMNFNVVGDVKIQGTHSAEVISISAILDNMEWLRKITTGAFKGSSGDAISKVAQQARLAVEKHATSDAMTWLSNNKPLAGFARHVMERGWASATSCMMMAVGDNAKLRYLDIDQVVSGGAAAEFGINGIPILQSLVSSKSNLYNNVAAYGATSTNFDPTGAFKELNKVDVRMLTNNFSFGDRNVGAIGDLGGRIMARALDVGNAHKKWSEALHQNQRIRTMYAHDVNILIDRISNSQLLDLVDVQLHSHGNTQLMAAQSGNYIVTGLTRMLGGNRYLEKLTVTSQGTN